MNGFSINGPQGPRKIGGHAPVFIVAEMSGNHAQKYEQAEAILRAAVSAGADAVKIQTYTPDTITLNSNKECFKIGGDDNPEAWQGKTLYELYQQAYTPWEWQPRLKQIADELGIIFFSTPFDETAVDFLEDLQMPCYKISSYEATDIPLLRKVAKTGKPIILSIGYATQAETETSVRELRAAGTQDLAILHCVTAYSDHPDLAAMNLKTIADIAERFNVVAGFSDNNGGIDIPVMATLAGAAIVEKHIVLEDKESVDSRFSVTPSELSEMIRRIRAKESPPPDIFHVALGKVNYGPVNEQEVYNLRFRRSLFVAKKMKKGEVFTRENLRDVRPAFGIETRFMDEILGKRAAFDVDEATPLSWNMIA